MPYMKGQTQKPSVKKSESEPKRDTQCPEFNDEGERIMWEFALALGRLGEEGISADYASYIFMLAAAAIIKRERGEGRLGAVLTEIAERNFQNFSAAKKAMDVLKNGTPDEQLSEFFALVRGTPLSDEEKEFNSKLNAAIGEAFQEWQQEQMQERGDLH